jgi:hypothetical protein
LLDVTGQSGLVDSVFGFEITLGTDLKAMADFNGKEK